MIDGNHCAARKVASYWKLLGSVKVDLNFTVALSRIYLVLKLSGKRCQVLRCADFGEVEYEC